MTITFEEFEKVDLRIGTIVNAEAFPEARKPAYILTIDLGEELGIKRSSAQITDLYTKEELINRQVICVTNLSPKQVGKVRSEVLVTGFIHKETVVLASCERRVPNGLKLK